MKLQHRVEAGTVRVALRALRAMSPAAASKLGGAVARSIGPLLPVSKVADANLRRVMPELDARERRRIVRGVWDNLGRVAAELPHVGRLERTESGPGWQIDGAELMETVAAAGGPALFLSGHIGNWELLPVACAHFGIRLSSFYRAASNSAVDEILTDLRLSALGGNVPMFRKGTAGARAAMAHLMRGGYLGLLVDQKMNDGIEVPFFGIPAMTVAAPAAFALRFRCPVVFGFSHRIGPARFQMTARQIAIPDTGNRSEDLTEMMRMINAALEEAIRAHPEEWLWLHRRWPKA